MIINEIRDILSRNISSDVLIILDDGHGWETAGKRSPDYDGDGKPDIKENHFNSTVMERLCILLSLAGIDYAKTAPEYWDVPLKERSRRERAFTKDRYSIFISIHANAANFKAHGYESFTRTDESQDASTSLAYHIEQQLKHYLPDLRMRGNKMSSKEKYNFHVLRETQSEVKILTEAAFMTNRSDAELLRSDDFIDIYTGCKFIGIINFMRGAGLLTEESPIANILGGHRDDSEPSAEVTDTTDTTQIPTSQIPDNKQETTRSTTAGCLNTLISIVLCIGAILIIIRGIT